MEEKENRKRKRREQKKREGQSLGRPGNRTSPVPKHHSPSNLPEPLLSPPPFFFSDVWDPHVISLLSPSTRALPPLMPPVTPRPFLLLSLSLDALPTKPPSPSPVSPPFSLAQIAPGRYNCSPEFAEAAVFFVSPSTDQ
jgi:hypothetical protein